MNLGDVFRRQWVFTRMPYIDAPNTMTPKEAAGLIDEYVCGQWEPMGYSAIGNWLLLRRKLRFREKLAAWLGRNDNAERQEHGTEAGPPAGAEPGKGPVPVWSDNDELGSLLAQGPRGGTVPPVR